MKQQMEYCTKCDRYHIAGMSDLYHIAGMPPRTSGDRSESQSERDAFELGPGGDVGVRLIDGFALAEGRQS